MKCLRCFPACSIEGHKPSAKCSRSLKGTVTMIITTVNDIISENHLEGMLSHARLLLEIRPKTRGLEHGKIKNSTMYSSDEINTLLKQYNSISDDNENTLR